ncbi:hypothetical protein DW352_17340 [Pseudolabrys taiwanensis]|uniref:Serine kinase n=1 Tax=Pseudolabrys taiwanensis TaxID=331696 RepID=A0A345ZYY8_9HYPH|nr:hypothetical protein [Pseudolabrys taiwanensis]AXK82135.1 hypothetical protein DW352_17340 [Pseudolabrys taiwanensis]
MKAAFALPSDLESGADIVGRLPSHFALDFCGAPVDIASTSDRAIATLRRVYRHFLDTTHEAAGGSERDTLLLIEEGTAEATTLAAALGRDAKDFDGHILIASWLGQGLRIANHALLHYYASKLLRLRIVERWHPEVVTLHAASLSAPWGGGLLLLGEAAAGKTTLTLRLIDDGFRYCADDTTCIRRRDLACLPFPMAFIVRGDLTTGLPGPSALRGRAPDLSLLDEPRWLMERWDAVGMPFQPTTLYFVARDPARAAGDIRPMPQADAALALLRNLMMPLGADADAFTIDPLNFDTCCRLAEACRCLAVNTVDLDRAHDVIVADYHNNARPLTQVAS